MKLIVALSTLTTATLLAQLTPEPKTDVSNKALITKSTPAAKPSTNQAGSADIAALRKIADDYYAWRNENYPVFSSDSGLHTWDDRLTDYSPAKIAERAEHIRKLLEQVRALPAAGWPKDDRIDWMLFRAQLEGADFNSRVLQSEKADPQIYVSECANGLFFAPEKGIRCAAQTRARRDSTSQADAGHAHPGRAQFAKARKAFRGTCGRLRALNRSPLQREPHDAGARSPV